MNNRQAMEMVEKSNLNFVDFALWSSRIALNPQTFITWVSLPSILDIIMIIIMMLPKYWLLCSKNCFRDRRLLEIIGLKNSTTKVMSENSFEKTNENNRWYRAKMQVWRQCRMPEHKECPLNDLESWQKVLRQRLLSWSWVSLLDMTSTHLNLARRRWYSQSCNKIR